MPWTIDTTHSDVSFSVRHMVFARVRGHFTRWSAEVDADDAGALHGLRATIELDSVDTREAQRDAHLRSADFFDVENHPHMTFVSTAIEAHDGGLRVTGDLTIRDATRPVTLRVEGTGTGKDPWGNQRQGYRATARIQRAQWGLTWNAALELGGVLVGEDVDIEIEAQLVRS